MFLVTLLFTVALYTRQKMNLPVVRSDDVIGHQLTYLPGRECTRVIYYYQKNRISSGTFSEVVSLRFYNIIN